MSCAVMDLARLPATSPSAPIEVGRHVRTPSGAIAIIVAVDALLRQVEVEFPDGNRAHFRFCWLRALP